MSPFPLELEEEAGTEMLEVAELLVRPALSVVVTLIV